MNERGSSPVPTSRFLVVLNHSEMLPAIQFPWTIRRDEQFVIECFNYLITKQLFNSIFFSQEVCRRNVLSRSTKENTPHRSIFWTQSETRAQSVLSVFDQFSYNHSTEGMKMMTISFLAGLKELSITTIKFENSRSKNHQERQQHCIEKAKYVNCDIYAKQ